MKLPEAIVRPGTPRTILVFAVAYVGFAVCAFVNNVLMNNAFLVLMTAAAGQEVPAFVGFLAFGVRLFIRIGLLWLILRRVSNIARWTIVVLALPWAYEAPQAAKALASGNMGWMPWLATFLFLTVSIVSLFLRETRLWFARKGQSIAADRSIFG